MRATLHLPVTRRIEVVRTTEWGNRRRTKQLAAFGFTGHRPPATLPSRSAIARPRLSARLPLGTLALFPPLRPGVFCLKLLRFQALLRFQTGFVWRFLWRRHVVREALPDAIALSRLACRVRTFVGQDYDLVIRRILSDRLRIVSHDRTGASLCHRLAALPFIAATRLHLARLIPHLQFAPRHLELALRGLELALRHLAFVLCHLAFAICHLPSAFSPSPFPVPNSSFRIFRRVSSVRSSSRCRADWYRRSRSNPGLKSSAARSAQSGSATASMASLRASSSLRFSTWSSMIVSRTSRASAALLGRATISRQHWRWLKEGSVRNRSSRKFSHSSAANLGTSTSQATKMTLSTGS